MRLNFWPGNRDLRSLSKRKVASDRTRAQLADSQRRRRFAVMAGIHAGALAAKLRSRTWRADDRSRSIDASEAEAIAIAKSYRELGSLSPFPYQRRTRSPPTKPIHPHKYGHGALVI